MRACKQCGLDKPLSDYWLRPNGTRNGATCKECASEQRRERYWANRDRTIGEAIAWGKAHPESVKASKKRYAATHPDEIRERNQAYYETTKETGKANRWRSWLKYNHGITPERYLEILTTQGGACAICEDFDNGTRRYRLHIDHDHHCCEDGKRSCDKCIRGLLCNRCNAALGRFDDNPQLLLKAYDYLTRKG